MRRLVWIVTMLLLAAACQGATPPEASPTPATPTAPTTASPATPATPASPSPTAPASPEPSPRPTAGPRSPSCVDGWVTPRPGTLLRTFPLDLIRGTMGVDGLFVVEDMRYFTGPDVPWIIAPHYEVVKRWYVKAYLQDDPSFRGRWLVERRSKVVAGVSGVASFDSRGFRSPDWRGFIGEGIPQAYDGLPGEWVGINYDFVTGEGDGDNPGLPREVVGCLRGT